MRQVPDYSKNIPYLIVGNGRLASHFRHYFEYLSIPHLNWWRGCDKNLQTQIAQTNKIIVLINDDAIVNFIQKHRVPDGNQIWIHCSGLISTALAESAHPLMTFSMDLYDVNTYQEILFVTESGRTSFPKLFPELPNPYMAIPAKQKGFYHAWCSMAGNFTTILWQEFSRRMKREFGMTRQMIYPYLKQITVNLQADTPSLTGPLTRGDWKTVKTHLESIADDDFQGIYKAFINVYLAQKKSRQYS